MAKIYSVDGNETILVGTVDDRGYVYDALPDENCVGVVDEYGAVYDDPFVGE